MESHLLQMRGLKQHLVQLLAVHKVASFTDAWIETRYSVPPWRFPQSHLLQMRGLKLRNTNRYINITECRIFYRCVD